MIVGWMARVAVMVFGVGGADTGNEVLEVLELSYVPLMKFI
jgi:hypothetical protein